MTGYVSEDTVSFGGFTLQEQRFRTRLSIAPLTRLIISPVAVDDVSIMGDILKDGLSGIMGLGFQTISTLQTPPFWQALYNQNLLPEPVFGFFLERHVDQVQKADTAPGGTFTLGGTNTSLYAGDIEFINMPSGTTPSYWLQQVQSKCFPRGRWLINYLFHSAVTIQGTSIDVPSNSGLAAIDTGTSLIGVPNSISQAIWARVPNSAALTGQYEGMYAFRTYLRYPSSHVPHAVLSCASQRVTRTSTSPYLSAVLVGLSTPPTSTLARLTLKQGCV